MNRLHNDNPPALDPELQPQLAFDALLGLDRLLTAQPMGEAIRCDQIGAIVKLIVQAAR